MNVERQLLHEIHPRRGRNRHFVKVYDMLDADTKRYLNWSSSIISQKIDPDGNILDEWFINIHPKEIDEMVEMLLEAKKIGVMRLMELAEKPEQEETGDDDRDGGRPGEVRARPTEQG